MSTSPLTLHQQLTSDPDTAHTAYTTYTAYTAFIDPHDEAAADDLVDAVMLAFDLIDHEVAILRDLPGELPDPDTSTLEWPRVQTLVLDLLQMVLTRYLEDTASAGRSPLDPSQISAILANSRWRPVLRMSPADVTAVLQFADDVARDDLDSSETGRWISAYSWTIAAHLAATPAPHVALSWVDQQFEPIVDSLPGRHDGGRPVFRSGPASEVLNQFLSDSLSPLDVSIEQFTRTLPASQQGELEALLRGLVDVGRDAWLRHPDLWAGFDVAGAIDVATRSGLIHASERDTLIGWFTDHLSPRTPGALVPGPTSEGSQVTLVRIALVATLLLLLSLGDPVQPLRPRPRNMWEASLY